MCAVLVLLAGGCATSPGDTATLPPSPTPASSPEKLERTAPAARDMEAPLNGGTRRSGAIEERMTVPVESVYGTAFPGAGEQPPRVMRDDAAEEAQARQAIEERLRAAEARLAEVESRMATGATTPKLEPAEAPPPLVVETLETKLRDLQEQVSRLERLGAQAAPPQLSPPATQNDVALRLAEIEGRLAALRNDAVRPEEAANIVESVNARFDVIEAQLAQLRMDRAQAAAQGGLVAQLPLPSGGGFGAYRIGAGDTLEFESYNDPALSRELVVRYDGVVSLPLIPDMPVSGKTREEAESEVKQAYRRVFKDPQLSLLVRETGSKTYSVVGDISEPGVYPYKGPTRLIEALSLAGGLRDRNSSSNVGGFVGITGQLTKAFVIRSNESGRDVLQYDLRGLGRPGAHASEAPIFPGDLIYVPEGVNLVYVLGESRNPVIVELTEGMTLLQLLALSGGFNTSTARLRSVVLIRQRDAERAEVLHVNVREMLNGGPDLLLNPGDILYIPRKRLVNLQEFVGRLTGSVLPVLDLYNSAVNAYYAKDLAEAILDEPSENRTLRVLGQLEQFGTSTQNLVNLFAPPAAGAGAR